MVAVVAMALTGFAVAKSKSYATQADFTTSNEGTKFEGYVKSDSPKCVKGRKVSLFYDTGGGQNVGTTKSNADGNWEIPGSFTAGLYHVEVAQKTIKTKRSKIKCKPGKSMPKNA
jgi:hypothetical protein